MEANSWHPILFHIVSESEKLKKGGGNMVQGQVFLKGGGGGEGGLPLFLFNFFKVYHFYI